MVAFCLCGGVILGLAIPPLAGVALLLSVTLLTAAWVVAPFRGWLLGGVWVALGVGLIHVHLYVASADDVAHLAGEQDVLTRAVIRNVSAIRPVGNYGEGLTAEADIVSLEGEDGVVPVSGRVRLWLRQADPRLYESGSYRMLGRLRRGLGASNPGEMNFAYRDAVLGVGAELTVANTGVIEVLPSESNLLNRSLAWWRELTRHRLNSGFSADSKSLLLLRSLLLGDSDTRLKAVQDDFQRSGTTHHLAVSGTHIAVVGGFVYLVLRTASLFTGWLTPRRMLLGSLAVILLYGAAVSPGPPVTRSVMLAAIVGAGFLIGRNVSIANLLGISAIVMVVWDPGQVLAPGFQLTFFVVWCLIVVAPGFYQHLLEYRDRDFLIADQWAPDRPEARRRRFKWKVIAGLSVAVVAWTSAAPIVGHHFSQANPYAWLASILLAPVVYAAIVAGVLKVVFSSLVPWLAAIWAGPAGWLSDLLRVSVHLAASAPGGEVGTPPLPGWLTVAALLGLAVPLLTIWKTRRWRTAVWSGAITAALLLPILTPLLIETQPGIRIAVLSVGAGQCVVIEDDAGGVTLIDAGGDGEVYHRVLEPYLRHRGIGRIQTVLLTHGDSDHVGAIPGLLGRRRVGELVCSSQMLEAKGAGKEVTSLATQQGVTVSSRAGGDTWQRGSVTFDVLHPEKGESWADNDSSMVVRVTYGGKVILFTGDIEAPAQRSLLRKPYELRADLLVAPHHGSFEDSTPEFVAATEATTLLVSADRSPSGKQRRFYRSFPNHQILSTATAGAITLCIAPDGNVTLQTFRSPTSPAVSP